MSRALRTAALMLGLMLSLAACSSPNPVLYTIAPVDGAALRGTPKVVVLQQVATARYLERSQIVRSSENYQIEVLSNDWWGEPLAAMIGRVLAEELGQRLPQTTVFVETGAVSAAPEATIALNVQRLDEDAAGNLVLEAQAAVTVKGRAQPILRNFRFSVHAPTADSKGEVAAISAAVGQLADGLAATLVTL
jgi:uncharacterized protein